MYIDTVDFKIQGDINDLELEGLKNKRTEDVFNFSNDISKRILADGFGINKAMDELLESNLLQLNEEFDRIVFKTILYKYIDTINITVDKLDEICVSGARRFLASDIGGLSNDITNTMINRLATVPNSFIDSSFSTKIKLVSFLEKNHDNLKLHIKFNEMYFKSKVSDAERALEEIKKSVSTKKWWQF